MTEIERKALALVNEVRAEEGLLMNTIKDVRGFYSWTALVRAIEQHEAYKQEVSDAVEMCDGTESPMHRLHRFILPKTVDPLVEALRQTFPISLEDVDEGNARDLRTAMQARGYEFTKINKEQN